MRDEQEILYNTFAIVSEPGDKTRYEYMVHRDGPDEFCFMPMKNTFRYPQRLNFYDLKDIPPSNMELLMDDTKIEIIALAKKENCSPHTLLECIRTVKILHERKMR